MDPNKMDARTVGDTNSQYDIISVSNLKFMNAKSHSEYKGKNNAFKMMSELSMSKIKPSNNML